MSEQFEPPRWERRYDNYRRALMLVREGMNVLAEGEIPQMFKEAIVQRFEFTWELAWKTLKDYLEHQGVVLPEITPRAVIRAALTAGLIHRGEDWMQALDDRNKMAHTYNFSEFERVVVAVRDKYHELFEDLNDVLEERFVLALAERGG